MELGVSEFLGYVGLVMVAVATAWLWMARLNSTAVPAVSHGDDHEDVERVPSKHSGLTLVLSPELPSVQVESKAQPEPVAHEEEKPRALSYPPADSRAEQPDSDSAREQLKIADQLSMIGDFEGVMEYAQLVINDADASDRQRAQAENLIRLARAR
jgi:hypothetical protein